jgi:TonB family protein
MGAELLAGNIAAHWVQAGVLAASALIAIRALSLDEPRAKLAALQLTLLAIVLLPFVQPWKVADSALDVTTSAMITSVVPREIAEGSIDAVSRPDPSLAIVVIVIAGGLMRLLWLFYGFVRLGRLGRTASTVPAPAVAAELEAELGVSARYIQQTCGRSPWTFGVLQAAVALPTGFGSLAPAFQRAVICHELLHIKRRDVAVAFLEELAVAALWFHPWVWQLRARIRVVREQVVDARVIGMLGDRDEYVRCLVDMSGHDLAPHVSKAGAGMLRPRELRARVDAIFEEVPMSRARFAVAGCVFIAVTIATGLVAVAALPLRSQYVVSGLGRTPAQTPATAAPGRQINRVYPEYPQDALERGIKGVVIVDIIVNAAGEVTTGAVAGGPQELRASAFKAALALKFTPGSSTTAMQIAVEYMLTDTNWGVKIGEALPNTGTRPMPRNAGGDIPAGPSNRDAAGAYRIGGGLIPPKKIKDVPPLYPPIAQQARVQGVVILETRIDENGNVSDTRVLRSIPLLDQAAIDAVKQWQYERTLMNGVAVPVIITVTVNFTLRDLLQMRVVLPDGNSMPFDTYSGARLNWEFAGIGKFQLQASRPRGSDDATISVFSDDGQSHLGDVSVTLNGPVVQTPTTPSIGLQFLGVR